MRIGVGILELILNWSPAEVGVDISSTPRRMTWMTPNGLPRKIMNITKEQLEQAKQGQPVELVENGDEFVLVRKDVYEQVPKVRYDDSELSDDELQAIAAQTLEDLDTAGPIE